MEIKKITDPAFRKYGRIVRDIDFTEIVKVLNEVTPLPLDVAYEPSVAELEALPVYKELEVKGYGEMPIEIGYCTGHNQYLNALEYHRTSEIDIGGTDSILLLGLEADVTDDYTYDTSLVEAFLLPKGVGVELFASTLHYAPCSVEGQGFKVVIVLPKNTNLPLTKEHKGGEDGHLTAINKWLIGHPEGGLPEGSPLGLIGENLSVK